MGQRQFTSFFQVSGFEIVLLKYFLTLSLLFLNLCRSQRWNPFVNQLHPASGILHFGDCSWERVKIFADKSWHFEVNGFFNSFFTNMDILLSCQIKNNSKMIDIDVFFRISLTNDPKSYPYLFEPFHSVWEVEFQKLHILFSWVHNYNDWATRKFEPIVETVGIVLRGESSDT